MGRLVFKDIALPVTSKRAFLFRRTLFKAQGTRHKVQVRHKAQETRRQVKETRRKAQELNLLCLGILFLSFLFLSWLLALDPWIFLVPCALSLVPYRRLVFQNFKLHASVQLTSFVGFVCGHWFGFTITLRGYATFRNTFRNNVLTY